MLILGVGAAWAGEEASTTIASASGAVTIDGNLDDAFWQKASVLALSSSGPFGAGGEIRLGVCGSFICLSARLPEPDRVVAHSTGRNPIWWSEDLVTWGIRVYDRRLRRNLNLSLSVNPLGAYRLDGAGGIQPLESAGSVMAASRVGRGEWTVEAAIALDELVRFLVRDFHRQGTEVVFTGKQKAPTVLSHS